MKKILIISALICAVNVSAQSNIQKTINYPTGNTKAAVFRAGKNDQTYLSYKVDYTDSAVIVLHSMNEDASINWSRTLNITDTNGQPNSQFPSGIHVTSDGGAILTVGDHGSHNEVVIIMKFDSDGNLQWSKSIATLGSHISRACLAIDANDNIYLSYASNYTLTICKMNMEGHLYWEKTLSEPSGFGSSGVDPNQIIISDSLLYITGYQINTYFTFMVVADTTGEAIHWEEMVGDVSANGNLHKIGKGSVILTSKYYGDWSMTHSSTRIQYFGKSVYSEWQLDTSAGNSPAMASINSNRFALYKMRDSLISVSILDTLANVMSSYSYIAPLSVKVAAFDACATKNKLWFVVTGSKKLWIMNTALDGNTDCGTMAYAPTIQFITSGPYPGITKDTSFVSIPQNKIANNVSPFFNNSPIKDTVLCGEITSVDLIKQLEILLYPNPGTDHLYINVPFASSVGANVIILDVAGRVVKDAVILSDNTMIEASSLPIGLYLIKINTAHEYKTLKWVKN